MKIKPEKIINKKLNEIMPYERNPRHNDDGVKYVAESIKEFGFKVPIVIDAAGVIVTGHTRYKAAKELGLEEVPCIIADDLDPYQIKAFRLADNKVTEFSDWDYSLLDEEIAELNDYFDLTGFGFEIDFEEELEDDVYTEKTDIPQYQITGEEPNISELLNTDKADELIQEIENSNVTAEQKAFLVEAAKRHNVFNYRNIAEYYAHQDKEMQELMERSALVIIDFEDAIKNGYVQLSQKIKEIREKDASKEE